MPIIVHIGKDFEIFGVASNTANVFWRTCSFAFNTNGLSNAICRQKATFEQDLMMPAITKIVFVLDLKSLSRLGQDVADLGHGRIDAIIVIRWNVN